MAVATAYVDQVQKAYIAYYGRPADTTGLDYWSNRLAAVGGNWSSVIDSFGNSAEASVLLAGMTNEAKINTLYQQMFGRTADTGGLTFYAVGMANGTYTLASIAVNILNGATGTDATAIANKLASAKLFTAGMDTTAEIVGYNSSTAPSVRTWLSGVTATAATQASVDSSLLAMTTAAAAVVTGQTFTLTTGVDQGAAFTGGSGNDIFTATSAGTANAANTLTAADVLNGGAGTDSLDITVTATDTNTLGSAQITGIETINVRSAVAGQTATVAASSAVGATAINSNAGAGALTVTALATGAAVGIIGNGTVTNGAVTFDYTTATDAVTLNVSNGTKVGTTVATTADTPTSVTINSTGAANTLGAIDFSTGATVTALTVNATTGLTATLAADYAATAALTVTGAGAVNVGANGTFKTVDASGNSGGLTMTLDTVTTSFKGSTGNDTISTVTLAAPAANIIDGGTGTDTLVVLAAVDVASAALRGSYTSFETLSNSIAAGAQIAADGFTGVTALITNAAGGGFSGMTAAQAASINVTANLAATGTTYALTTATGTSDVLGLNFVKSNTTLNATALTVTGFETLNLTAASALTPTTTFTGKSLYNVDTTTAATAGTDYDQFAITAGADLKTVTLSGAYAADVTLVANQVAVTALNASANTAGAKLTVGGQTGSLVVTGTASRDIITLNAAGAGGLQTVNAGDGNDLISATQAIMAVATINGGAGIDTMALTDAGTTTIADNSFATVTAIEKITTAAVTGLTFSVGGYANALATANAGVLDVTAASIALTTGALAIDATGLSAGNSLKLSVTNSDATVSAGSSTITLSQGADNITIVQAGAGNTDTITISGGVAALAATTAKTIDLSGVTVSGAIAVTTGAGADNIKCAAVAGTYTGGLGADTFTAGAGTDTFAMGTNGSVAGTSMDVIGGYATGTDVITFGAGTTLLAADATALVAGANVQTSAGGLVTFATADNTLALKIAAIQADVQLDAAGSIAVFNDGGNAYVYYAGAAIGNADDQVIQLTGITAASIAAGPTTIVS